MSSTLDSPVAVAGRIAIEPGPAEQGLTVSPRGAVPASTSTGGAVRLDNTNSSGAGLVIYSNRGADAAGRMLVVRNDNAANPQQAVFVDHKGSGHGVNISSTSTGTNANALLVTSTNPNDTTMGVSGTELAKGTIKVTHDKPAGAAGNDPNASALSLRTNGVGTAAQMIFGDAEDTGGTTGKLINLRQVGVEKFVVHANGEVQLTETASPVAAVADRCILYAKDNGAGKTQLVARFSGGDVILATSL